MELIRKAMGVWILFEFLILPFSYTFLPSPGIYFHWSMISVTDALAHLFNEQLIIQDPTLSDSISSYIWAAVSFPLALGIALFIERVLKKEINSSLIKLFLLYLLSFFLLRYGIDKILGNQFQSPEPNILTEKVGNLSKDLLYWTSMGTSSVYNQFMGWAEVIAGTLLLFPSSRKIGLYFSLVIFVNVFLINIGFDISVKFLSALLLTTSAWLLISEKSEQIEQSKFTYLAHALSLFLLLELIVSGIRIMNKVEKEFQGTFLVEESTDPDLPPKATIHLNSKGYLIIEKDDQFKSYPINVSGKKFHFTFQDNNSFIGHIENGKLQLASAKDTVTGLQVNTDYLLLRDKTHWMVESF